MWPIIGYVFTKSNINKVDTMVWVLLLPFLWGTTKFASVGVWCVLPVAVAESQHCQCLTWQSWQHCVRTLILLQHCATGLVLSQLVQSLHGIYSQMSSCKCWNYPIYLVHISIIFQYMQYAHMHRTFCMYYNILFWVWILNSLVWLYWPQAHLSDAGVKSGAWYWSLWRQWG